MIYFICYTACWFLARLLFRFEVEGREHMVKDRGVVLCSNHISMIDPILVEIAWGGYPKFAVMGKAELFKNPLLAFFFKSVGVFPVNRGAADTEALDKAVEGVKSGRGLLICPEGTRSKDGRLGKLKSGAFLIAAQTGAPIQPCCVVAPGGKIKLFGKVKVVFGPIITPEELQVDEKHRSATARRAKALLLSRYEDMLPPEAFVKEEPENPALTQAGEEAPAETAAAATLPETEEENLPLQAAESESTLQGGSAL